MLWAGRVLTVGSSCVAVQELQRLAARFRPPAESVQIRQYADTQCARSCSIPPRSRRICSEQYSANSALHVLLVVSVGNNLLCALCLSSAGIKGQGIVMLSLQYSKLLELAIFQRQQRQVRHTSKIVPCDLRYHRQSLLPFGCMLQRSFCEKK